MHTNFRNDTPNTCTDHAGRLQELDFSEFHLEDADRAALEVGMQTVTIIAAELQWGRWRATKPLEFEARDVITLRALAPTAADLLLAEHARTAHLQGLSDAGETISANLASVTLPWRFQGLTIAGLHERSLGGYLDLAQVPTGNTVADCVRLETDVLPVRSAHFRPVEAVNFCVA